MGRGARRRRTSLTGDRFTSVAGTPPSQQQNRTCHRKSLPYAIYLWWLRQICLYKRLQTTPPCRDEIDIPIVETCAVRNSLSSSGTHTGPSVILRSYVRRQTQLWKTRYCRCCVLWLSSPAPRRAPVHVRTSVERWCSGWAGIQRVARPAQTPATNQHGYQSTMVWWTCREYHRRQARGHRSSTANGETHCPRREAYRPDLPAEDVPKGFRKDTLRPGPEPLVAWGFGSDILGRT